MVKIMRSMRRFLSAPILAALVALLAFLLHLPARTCSPPPLPDVYPANYWNNLYGSSPITPAPDDETPPAFAQPVSASLTFYTGEEEEALDWACDLGCYEGDFYYAVLLLDVEGVADDTTPTEYISFLLEASEEVMQELQVQLPELHQAILNGEPLRSHNGGFAMLLASGSTDQRYTVDLDVEVQVSPVDLRGNIGEAQQVRIVYTPEREPSCSVSRGTTRSLSGLLPWLLLGGLLDAGRRFARR